MISQWRQHYRQYEPIFPVKVEVPAAGSTENTFVTANPAVGCYNFTIYLNGEAVNDPELEIILDTEFLTLQKQFALLRQQLEMSRKQTDLLQRIE